MTKRTRLIRGRTRSFSRCIRSGLTLAGRLTNVARVSRCARLTLTTRVLDDLGNVASVCELHRFPRPLLIRHLQVPPRRVGAKRLASHEDLSHSATIGGAWQVALPLKAGTEPALQAQYVPDSIRLEGVGVLEQLGHALVQKVGIHDL